ncbi:Integrin alpha-10, partial [Galemys pyrenaicus]
WYLSGHPSASHLLPANLTLLPPGLGTPFNLDVRHPRLFPGPPEAEFGYSVLQHVEGGQRMLVGAPWDGPSGDRRGDVYRCPVGGSHTAPCAKGHLGDYPLGNSSRPAVNMHLGMSLLETGGDGGFMACAPLWSRACGSSVFSSGICARVDASFRPQGSLAPTAQREPAERPRTRSQRRVRGCPTYMDVVIVLDGSNSIYPWSEVQTFLRRLVGRLFIDPEQIQVRRAAGRAWGAGGQRETARRSIQVATPVVSTGSGPPCPPCSTWAVPHGLCHECTPSSQVGLVQYGESAVHEWSLGDFRTKGEVVRAARNLSRREGRETKTAQAILEACTEGFSQSRGGRPEAARLLVVVTDGESHDGEELPAALEACEAGSVTRYGIAVLGHYLRRQRDPSSFLREIRAIASDPDERFFFNVTDEAALTDIVDALGDRIFGLEGSGYVEKWSRERSSGSRGGSGGALWKRGGSGVRGKLSSLTLSPCFLDRGSHGENESSFGLEMSQIGFSTHRLKDGILFGMVGAYDWGGSVLWLEEGHRLFPPRTALEDEFPPALQNHAAYLGYSVSSMLLRGGHRLFLSGAPRFRHRGKVIAFQLKKDGSVRVAQSLQGEQIGSYFGSELCALDADGDGTTDVLLVAAPMFLGPQNKETGRVYVYLVGQRPVLTLQRTLQPEPPQDARFGFALAALPDLNQDGFADVAVGAPLEDGHRGALYLYHGAQAGLGPRAAQRVAAVSMPRALSYFGRSVDGRLDLDGDELVDVAVGAQGAAVLLSSRPIVRLEPSLTVAPPAVSVVRRDCRRRSQEAACLSAALCFRATSRTPGRWDRRFYVRFSAALDEWTAGARAAFDGSGPRLSPRRLRLSVGNMTCEQLLFHVVDTSDYLRPVALTVTFALDNTTKPGPVLDAGSPTSIRTLVSGTSPAWPHTAFLSDSGRRGRQEQTCALGAHPPATLPSAFQSSPGCASALLPTGALLQGLWPRRGVRHGPGAASQHGRQRLQVSRADAMLGARQPGRPRHIRSWGCLLLRKTGGDLGAPSAAELPCSATPRKTPFTVRGARQKVLVSGTLENREEHAYNASLSLSFSRNLHLASFTPQGDSPVKVECVAPAPHARLCSVGHPVFRAGAKVTFLLEFEFSCSALLGQVLVRLAAASDSLERSRTLQDNSAQASAYVQYEPRLLFSSASTLHRYEVRPYGTLPEGPGPEFKTTLRVQNLDCYGASGLVLTALLPAAAGGGSYFLSLSQVISPNASCEVQSLTEPPGPPVHPEELQHTSRLAKFKSLTVVSAFKLETEEGSVLRLAEASRSSEVGCSVTAVESDGGHGDSGAAVGTAAMG